MKARGKLVLCLVIFILFGLGAYSTIVAAPFAYIPNSGSNTVTVIDTATTPPECCGDHSCRDESPWCGVGREDFGNIHLRNEFRQR